jgi:DNA-directed RNA polymerase beta subunit
MNNQKSLRDEYLKRRTIINSFFLNKPLSNEAIESFNILIEKELQQIIEENGDIEPTIIPHNIDDFKIRFDKIWVTMPEITEADGSKRVIYPMEARLRKLTYSAPIYIEVSAHINGVQREAFTTQVGNLPIMLKSKHCHLSKLSKDELIDKGEDPDDPGGYFIVNGTEKVLVNIEDLAANKMLVETQKIGPSQYVGKLFSEMGSYKIPHQIERLKDGIFYISFTRVKRVPIVIILKALGLLKDEEIMKYMVDNLEHENTDVLINLYDAVTIKTEEDAIDYIAKKIGITQSKEIRIERTKEILDKYLLPHLGINEEDRLFKAYNLCKMVKRYQRVASGQFKEDDKDHYMNKRLKLPGDLLADLIRVNLKVLIGDLLYNFQRIVKRGKFPSIKVVIRDKLLTSRIYSALATGNWAGGRKGISQRIQRLNYLDTMSHLQRVVSPLSASQENFAARELHSTHLGRLCPLETPEGTNIGLRKNFSIMTKVSQPIEEDILMENMKSIGLKTIK